MKNDDVKYIFDQVNNWLNFAEVKNGTLIALNVALMTYVRGEKALKGTTRLSLILVLLALSVLISIKSFWPKSVKSNRDNPLFYGDIAPMDQKEYEKIISEERTLRNHILAEIRINSQITVSKYKHFKFSLILDIIAISIYFISKVAPLIQIVLKLLHH